MRTIKRSLLTLVALLALTSGARAQSTDPEVTWNATTKEATFTMPDANVELEIDYYPAATVTTAPTAVSELVYTGENQSLVTSGVTGVTIGTTTPQYFFSFI